MRSPNRLKPLARPKNVESVGIPSTRRTPDARVVHAYSPGDDIRLGALWMSGAFEQDHYTDCDQDVSKGKRAPWRIVSRQLQAKMRLGMSVEAVCDFFDEWKSRAKAWAGAVCHLPISATYRRMIEAESRSNYAQYLAVENPTTENLENAARESKIEIARNEDFLECVRRELMRRMNGLPAQAIAAKSREIAS